MYKKEDTTKNKLYTEMETIINTANAQQIIDFFKECNTTTFSGDQQVAHLVINIDDISMDESTKIEILNFLIQKPYNLSLININSNGYTPLHLAIIKRYFHIVKFLIEFEIKVTGFV